MAKSNVAFSLWESLTVCSKQQSGNLLNTILAHNLVGNRDSCFYIVFCLCSLSNTMNVVQAFQVLPPLCLALVQYFSCLGMKLLVIQLTPSSLMFVTTVPSMVLLCRCNIKLYSGKMRKGKSLKVWQIKAAANQINKNWSSTEHKIASYNWSLFSFLRQTSKSFEI